MVVWPAPFSNKGFVVVNRNPWPRKQGGSATFGDSGRECECAVVKANDASGDLISVEHRGVEEDV